MILAVFSFVNVARNESGNFFLISLNIGVIITTSPTRSVLAINILLFNILYVKMNLKINKNRDISSILISPALYNV